MSDFRKTSETLADGARTLPGRFYTSSELFATEVERIFFDRWLCVCREERIEQPGDFLVVEIGAESVIVARDPAGGLRAFYNVCRHRGTRLCDPGRGHARTLRCPYHAWTYDLTGTLVKAPLMDEVEGFRTQDYALEAVAAASWEGFVFVNLSARPEPFRRAFAPVLDRFSRWHLGGLRVADRQEYEVRANWKIVMENYSECYHCPLVHPEFSRKAPYRSGRNDLFEGPFLGGFMDLGPGVESLTRSGRRCGPALGDVAGADLGRVYFYAFFPTMTLALHPDYVMSFVVWPLDCGRTRVEVEWLFAASDLAAGRCDPHDAVGFWDATNREDWEVCARVQDGLRSRSYRPALCSTTESLPVAFDRQVIAALGEPEDG